MNASAERYDVRLDGRSLVAQPVGRLGALSVVQRELGRNARENTFTSLVVVESETYECRACWVRTARGVMREAVPGWL